MAQNAVVIGSGVIGGTAALALQRAGFAVTLVDPMRVPSGASWGNAGHIAIEQAEPLASRAALRSVPGRLFARGGFSTPDKRARMVPLQLQAEEEVAEYSLTLNTFIKIRRLFESLVKL